MFDGKSLKRFVFKCCVESGWSCWLQLITFIHSCIIVVLNLQLVFEWPEFEAFYPCHFESVHISCLVTQNKNRINKAGELLVTSELSRSQQRNLSDCIQKISAIIAEASEKPHEPTAEDIALRAARYDPAVKHIVFLSTLILNVSLIWNMLCRLDKANKERLKQKKIHSAIKSSRRVDFD